MSTKVVPTCPDRIESLTSLEYLVSPVQEHQEPPKQRTEITVEERLRSDFNNALQSLTNLVYLLSREGMEGPERQTMLTLVLSEVARLSVLSRRIGLTPKINDCLKPEVTQ